MPGLLAFHAHPDDEVTSTGGVLAKYSGLGEQVVVVTATDGAEGEIHNYDNPDELRPCLVEIRVEELAKSLAILGVPNHHYLEFRDSGMMGTEANQHPESFWQADFMDATARLVRLVRRYTPEVMTIYDPFGGYGHPDHIQVHRVGMAAYFGAEDVARFPLEDGEEPWQATKLYMSTWPRSRVVTMTEARVAAGRITREEAEKSSGWGTPDEDISTMVDVSDQVDLKVEALRAHRSQIPEDWFMLQVGEEDLPTTMGVEAFQRLFSRIDVPFREDDLFTGIR